jgi:hypothetical protein
MATTIRSTALDFANIKANLIEELKAKQEFEDYDFEASGLSNILDVLAYNTHVNGLVANFTLNESFLGTAQLRSSVVSLATSLGYIPDTKTSARGLVRATVNLSGVDTPPSVIQMPAYTRFTSVVDDITYTFQTLETYSAENDGAGIYTFVDADGNTSIPVFEGMRKTKNFLVGKFSANDVYIIPDLNMDGDTVSVNVYDTPGGSSFTPFTNIVDATSVNENSTLYILKEAPNEFFQLAFGANDILGRAPKSGNAIVVDYLSASGAIANAAQNFQAIDAISLGESTFQISSTTVSRAAGGDEKESIESIRRNAPFQYATQNRMVTPEDYTSIILRNFSTLIKDIKSWGGQDNPQPKFGTVFSSILFEDDVTASQQTATKTAISELVEQLAVISFNVEFADPVDTFIENEVFFQINPKLTPITVNAVKQNVKSVIANYFDETIGGFNKSFRRSALLSLVDDVSPAILSSRANIKIQQRIVPTVNAKNTFDLKFPVTLRSPDDEDPIITSSSFQVSGQTVRIENKLKSNTLQIKAIGSGDVIVDNIGSYNPLQSTLQIVSFKPNALLGGVNYIKISAIPANQSAITPLLNEILKFDEDVSRIVPVTISANN